MPYCPCYDDPLPVDHVTLYQNVLPVERRLKCGSVTFTSLLCVQGVRQEMIVAPSFVAVVIAVLIWWVAYTTKTKLQE